MNPKNQNQNQITLEEIALPPKARGMLFGITESGKSTLAEKLLDHWLRTHPRSRVLIVDSKPRFRGENLLNGLPANRLYRKWSHGTPVPDSYVLPLRDPGSELKQVWRLKGRVAIAQTGDLAELWRLREAMSRFYDDSDAKYQQLAYVDEVADFFGSSGMARTGDSMLKIVRSGREKGCAFLGASQRPKGIPKSLLTECTQYYTFMLANPDDVDHIREMRLPDGYASPDEDHVFAFYSRKSKAFYPRLKLGGFDA